MFQPRNPHLSERRRGIILLVVLALLTLFAIVGISFVLVADAEATASRLYRESGDGPQQPDLTDPYQQMTFFLGQLIYDADDSNDTTPGGVYSAIRGHSLARLMYGWDGTPANNTTPFNGLGRVHTYGPNIDPQPNLNFPGPLPPAAPNTPATYMNPFNLDDYFLPNYTFFRDDPQIGQFFGPGTLPFLRDPERLNPNPNQKGQVPWRTAAAQASGPFTGGFNAPYTYPDLNNMFLAAVNANGTVMIPSFHRPWLFGSLDVNNPNWTNAVGKYLTLRPRPIDMGPNFPYPEDSTGDVKNLRSSVTNDSVWIDLDAPIIRLPDGRKMKPLFAPLIFDLDNRVNINTAGNISGTNQTHRSNQGFGPWEVNLSLLVTNTTDYKNLFTLAQPNPFAPEYIYRGRYEPSGLPGNGGAAAAGRTTHFYGQVDYDGRDENTGNSTNPFQFPNGLFAFPIYSPGYGDGSNAERRDLPSLYNAIAPPGGNFLINVANIESLVRYTERDMAGRLGASRAAIASNNPALPGTELVTKFCPNTFGSSIKARGLITPISFDVDRPGVTPWLYNNQPQPPTFTLPPQYNQYTMQAPAAGLLPVPVGSSLPFPGLLSRYDKPVYKPAPPGFNTPQSELASDWRALTAQAIQRIDLNRGPNTVPPLRPYPSLNPGSRYDINPGTLNNFATAQGDRQKFADDFYRMFLQIAGVPPVAAPGAPTPAEIATRRHLAQLAVNIVDFIDEDDISTPFNFYTTADAGAATFPIDTMGPSGSPQYWVFGTELPHVLVNEVLAEYIAPPPSDTTKKSNTTSTMNLFVEIHNPFLPSNVPGTAGAPGTPGAPLQVQDGQPVRLNVPKVGNSGPAYAPYHIVLATQVAAAGGNNDNVLGLPVDSPFLREVGNADFAAPVKRIDTMAQLPAGMSPFIDVSGGATQTNTGFFLLGGAATDAHNSIMKASAKGGSVPDNTPFLQPTTNLQLPLKLLWDVPTQKWVGDPTDPVSVQMLSATGGVTVMMRRLVNPHLPNNTAPAIVNGGNYSPNPLYNPYMTTDYMEHIPAWNTEKAEASRGKLQPYAAAFVSGDPTKPVNNLGPLPARPAPQASSQLQDQTGGPWGGTGTPAKVQTSHSFGLQNVPSPPPAPPAVASSYDWLVHLDRQVVSPMELLQVSGVQPYQLTQQFKNYGYDTVAKNYAWKDFNHLASWFDQTTRLYRVFEFLETGSRAAGVGVRGRVPGRLNINTVWDVESLQAYCDAEPSTTFKKGDVQLAFDQLTKLRTPGLGKGTLDYTDRPFRSLATGFSLQDKAPGPPRNMQYPIGSVGISGLQYPTRNLGINDTLLASKETDADTNAKYGSDGAKDTKRALEVAGATHPYAKYQLLTKLFNNVTTRSNTFAVIVTVGYFEVTDDTSRPMKLGAEIGRSENKNIRHRFFAVVDRSVLTGNPGPSAGVGFLPTVVPSPGAAAGTVVVPYYNIIE